MRLNPCSCQGRPTGLSHTGRSSVPPSVRPRNTSFNSSSLLNSRQLARGEVRCASLIHNLSHALKSGKISAVELTSAYLDRVSSNVMTHVNKMQGKLLLIHGLIDENVHFRHTARLINKLISGKYFFLRLPYGIYTFTFYICESDSHSYTLFHLPVPSQ